MVKPDLMQRIRSSNALIIEVVEALNDFQLTGNFNGVAALKEAFTDHSLARHSDKSITRETATRLADETLFKYAARADLQREGKKGDDILHPPWQIIGEVTQFYANATGYRGRTRKYQTLK